MSELSNAEWITLNGAVMNLPKGGTRTLMERALEDLSRFRSTRRRSLPAPSKSLVETAREWLLNCGDYAEDAVASLAALIELKQLEATEKAAKIAEMKILEELATEADMIAESFVIDALAKSVGANIAAAIRAGFITLIQHQREAVVEAITAELPPHRLEG